MSAHDRAAAWVERCKRPAGARVVFTPRPHRQPGELKNGDRCRCEACVRARS